jgi:Na+/H+ antiporter NhaD/arsenite permease-like protein
VVSTIFTLTYLALALGRIPGLRIDRAGIALVGAAAMLACGVLSMHDAAKAVDYETIVLLFGMMVVVAYLRLAGFFGLATDWIATRFSGPYSLLAVTIALSGVLSAFLVNDVVCVALTPLVLHLITVGLFFAGQPIALVALGAAGALMLDRVRPERVYRAIDWPLLVMFAGLFIVVHAFEVNVVQTWGLERWHALLDSPVGMVSALSVVLSNLVSNVPAVLLFKPLMEVMPEKELAWLALSMSSTLAGNLTILGSVANLIVVENARRAGTELGFVEYLKVGVPLTVLTTLVGVAWLALVHY